MRAEKRGKRIKRALESYFSRIGLKIAVPVALFIAMPFLGHIFVHEYLEKKEVLYDILTNPAIWGIVLIAFFALMYILSRVVIIPLKNFETHITDLEKGRKTGPFELKTNDELEYLADRFNSLHSLVTNEISARDAQLSILYEYTKANSGVFDIQTLMENFFNIIKKVVDYDIGAYVLSANNRMEGRIYCAFGGLDLAEAEEIQARLVSRAKALCFDFPQKIGPIEVTTLKDMSFQRPSSESNGHSIDLPIICYGRPIGVVSLISYSRAGTDPMIGSRVFNAMVRQTSNIIERLMAHIYSEETKLANILSSMTEGVYIVDGRGNATCMNKKGMELLEFFCKNSLECTKLGDGNMGCCSSIWGREMCEFSRVIDKIRNFGPEYDVKTYTEEIKNKDGITVLLSVSNLTTGDGEKEGYVITAKDVTEDRLIQKRLMLSSKLTALGEMAAGIAHEVNNPLQVMMANIELLEYNVTDKGQKRIESLRDGILRIKGIVRDLLIFAREQTTEVEDVDINTMVQKVSDLIGHQLKVANITLDLDLDRRALFVKCNRNLFQQVLINLLQNAKDAIEEARKGSRVYVRTVLLPGGIVVVEVTDDGPGIPENVIDRIFDPFFTTKDVGKGTGLGLSVSRRIIEGMGGNITVASSPQGGTTFTITLLHNRTRKKEDRVLRAEDDFARLKDKSIILVDDEEGVLRAVKESLSGRVREIDTTASGTDAIEKLMDRDYDHILMDIKMPGMDGVEIFRHIQDTKPYLCQRVIFLTGDTENETTGSFIKLTGCKFLSKPFTIRELLSLMSEYEPEAR